MRRENLFRNKATKGLVAALAVAMATTVTPVSADAASAKKVTIAKGDTVKKAGKKGSFKTNKKKVAKVNKNGKITAVKAGKAKITATTKKGKKVTYNVTVKKAPTISKKKVSVTAGNSKKVTVNKNGAKYLKVSFKSSNPSVATVNKNGKITGVAAGTANVTATVKGHTKNYKLKVAVTVNAASVPDENQPTTPTEQNLVITEGTNLVAGTYNTVTIKSSVPANATVALGAAKIKTLYVESGSEYNVDAVQAEIENIEVVGSGQATAAATRVAKAPRINLGNNTKASTTKLVVKADVYFAGSAKLGSVNITAAANAYFETAIGQLSVEGNAAKVSLHGAVDELAVKGENASVGVFAAVTTMTVEGKQASIVIARSFVVTTMTITAENVSVSGNGTVSDLKINAAGAVVQTAVTKATIDASVTAGATIGGIKRNPGEVSNIAAVAGQPDTDPVTTVVDQGSTSVIPPSGGSSGGGSYVTPTTQAQQRRVFANGKTTKITATIGTAERLELTTENLKKWLNGTNTPDPTYGTQYLRITRNGTDMNLPVPVHTPNTTTPSNTPNSIAGVNVESSTFAIGSYMYKITVQDISNSANADVAVITVDCLNVPNNMAFNVTTDNTQATSSQVTINSGDSKQNVATVTYGNTTIKVTKEDIKRIYTNGTITSAALPISVTVNGTTTNATAVPTNALQGLTNSSSLVSYAYTPANGPTFILNVTGVGGQAGARTATISVTVLDAPNATSNNVNLAVTAE